MTKAMAWATENYQGDGFRVRSGVIYIDNPGNVRSFLDSEGRPNSSAINKEFGAKIHRALVYQYRFMGNTWLPAPTFDAAADAWFKGFMGYTYPGRSYNQYNNSVAVRKSLYKLIK